MTSEERRLAESPHKWTCIGFWNGSLFECTACGAKWHAEVYGDMFNDAAGHQSKTEPPCVVAA